MAEPNAFAAAQSDLGGATSGARAYPNIELVASGRKLVSYAIVLYLVLIGVGAALPPDWARNGPPVLFTLAGVSFLSLSCVGVYRVATGLEYGRAVRALCMLSMVILIANLVVLFVLKTRATRALRVAGFTVGPLGASKTK